MSSSKTIPTICELCIAAKQHHDPLPKGTANQASKPLELVISDVHGPLPVHTTTGHWYWIMFTDDHTRYRHVYLLRMKDEAFEAYHAYEVLVEN